MEDEAVRRNRGNVITVIVVGLILGAFTSVFAFALVGGGHGLNSSVLTFSTILLAPAAFVSALRGRRIAMLVIAVIGIALDIVICMEGMGEQIFAKVWNHVPNAFAIWIICWLSWQFVLVAALCRPSRKAANE